MWLSGCNGQLGSRWSVFNSWKGVGHHIPPSRPSMSRMIHDTLGHTHRIWLTLRRGEDELVPTTPLPPFSYPRRGPTPAQDPLKTITTP